MVWLLILVQVLLLCVMAWMFWPLLVAGAVGAHVVSHCGKPVSAGLPSSALSMALQSARWPHACWLCWWAGGRV